MDPEYHVFFIFLFIFLIGKAKENLLITKKQYRHNIEMIFVVDFKLPQLFSGVNERNNDTHPLKEAINDTTRINYNHQHLVSIIRAIK